MVIIMNKQLQLLRTYFSRASRIVWNSALAFSRNEDSLKASALTFYTLISIVPFLAVAFGIASGFGFEQYLEVELNQAFDEQQEVIAYAIKFAHSLLQNAKGSLIAGVGLIALLWTNLSMLGNIENALNDIWHVRQPRSWAKKMTDYLAVMIICPIFFVVSSSLSVYLITQITEQAKASHIVELVSPILFFFLKIIPFFLSIALFVVIYLFIPNVRVSARPRFIAGVIAGIAFQLWQWIYIKFQVDISSYGAIYGTFAALPLFLVWLQVSWLILLAGAELAAQIENETVFIPSDERQQQVDISPKQLGLLILLRCIHAFSKGEAAPTTLQIAKELAISPITTQHMIDMLEDSDILVDVGMRGNTRIGYQPSRDARLFTIKSVCDAIEKQIGWTVLVEDSPALKEIGVCLDEFEKIIEQSRANLTLDQVSTSIDK